MKKINPNVNLDNVAIGGSIAAVGVGSQIPALSGIVAGAIESCEAAKVGALLAGAVIETVGAPVLIIGGLALVGCALFAD